ncbi:hypothetical protein [Methylobacterium nodulans]|uniref:Uncharacterized protein n=1 Tax=Methylobacterium nodulans (strain LMG 21967 / CNCM I-2342 / ORS 2060) TaxID=460265 RepID=B8IUU0_METNO|nr:hypothetical protein [Methylobacterium nodulans]ACL58998.1 hypothetical protein Mnod_4119 [Methylobacterium nodulans ORS 2060]
MSADRNRNAAVAKLASGCVEQASNDGEQEARQIEDAVGSIRAVLSAYEADDQHSRAGCSHKSTEQGHRKILFPCPGEPHGYGTAVAPSSPAYPADPARATYEARFAGFTLGPRGAAPAWDDLGGEAREVCRAAAAAAREGTLDPRDAFTDSMILFAVRYCLGRHSYAPGLCCDWLREHWPHLRPKGRDLILRDIREHVERQESRPPESRDAIAGWEIDLQIWKSFLTWAEAADGR